MKKPRQFYLIKYTFPDEKDSIRFQRKRSGAIFQEQVMMEPAFDYITLCKQRRKLMKGNYGNPLVLFKIKTVKPK